MPTPICSCPIMASAVRSFWPTTTGTTGSCWPSLTRIRTVRWRRKTVPGSGSCDRTWSRGTLRSARRPSTRISRPARLIVSLAAATVRPCRSGTVTSRARLATRTPIRKNIPNVAASATPSTSMRPAPQTRVRSWCDAVWVDRLDGSGSGDIASDRKSVLRGLAPHQHGGVKHLELMAIRARGQVAACVEQFRRYAVLRPRVGRDEARVGVEERVCDLFVLLGLARARGVDDPSAGDNEVGRRVQHAALVGRKPRKLIGGTRPLQVGIAPERPEARAGCVDHDTIEALRERQRPASVELDDRHG